MFSKIERTLQQSRLKLSWCYADLHRPAQMTISNEIALRISLILTTEKHNKTTNKTHPSTTKYSDFKHLHRPFRSGNYAEIPPSNSGFKKDYKKTCENDSHSPTTPRF
jgi:hypothetical protein